MNILVVVDMQNDFVFGCLGSETAQKALIEVEKAIKNFSGKIIFTQDTHNQHYLSTNEGKHLPVPHCIKDTEGWQICKHLLQACDISSLTPLSEVDDVVNALQHYNVLSVEKHQFGSLNLALALKQVHENIEPIEQIMLCGVCTDICVISNALMLKAVLPEVQLSVLPNACAGVNEALHQHALEVMKSCQVDML